MICILYIIHLVGVFCRHFTYANIFFIFLECLFAIAFYIATIIVHACINFIGSRLDYNWYKIRVIVIHLNALGARQPATYTALRIHPMDDTGSVVDRTAWTTLNSEYKQVLTWVLCPYYQIWCHAEPSCVECPERASVFSTMHHNLGKSTIS